jgi:hypothetical protein
MFIENANSKDRKIILRMLLDLYRKENYGMTQNKMVKPGTG